VVTDFEVPPDEPLGGSDRLGLTRDDDDDTERPSEAYTTGYGAGVYADFPEEPGGFNREYPPAYREASAVPVPMRGYTQAAEGAMVGAGLGGLVGMLAGMAGLTVPGIGPLLAAGPLAATLSGLITGGATGAIAGALATAGLPEDYIQDYAAHIEQGHTLVIVRADELTRDPVERVLVANEGENVYCHES
jgi:outer membrane lipoprotein SlyB